MSQDLDTAPSKTEAAGLWEKISDSLRSSMDPETFDLWLKPVRQVSFDESRLTLGVPNRFFNDWIILHCKDKIESVLQTLAGPQAAMELVIFQDQDIPAKEAIPEILISRTEAESTQGGVDPFNPKYTFETFIEG